MIVVLSITLNKNISNWDPPRKFNPWIRLLSYCLGCVGGGNKNQVQLDCITPSPIKMMSTAWGTFIKDVQFLGNFWIPSYLIKNVRFR